MRGRRITPAEAIEMGRRLVRETDKQLAREREAEARRLESWESFQEWTPEPTRICPVCLVAAKCALSRLDWEY